MKALKTFGDDLPLTPLTGTSAEQARAARSACVRWVRSRGLGRVDAVDLWAALGIVPEQGGQR